MGGSLAGKLGAVVLMGVILTVHAADPEILYSLTPGVRPKALVLFEGLLDMLLVSPLGRGPAVFVLILLTALGCFMAYTRHHREAEAAATA